MTKEKEYSIYFAGDLFNHKDLLGNAALADVIFKISNGNYKCVLPQDLEQNKSTPKAIRDSDILNLLSSDIAIFNFDGSELDSGTVVEFMIAKFADIPAVVLRSDFRGGGDCCESRVGDSSEVYPPWNLMASFYPRTKILLMNCADEYANASGENSLARAFAGIEAIAKKVVKALDEVVKSKPIMKATSKSAIYDWLVNMPNLDKVMRVKLRRVLAKK